MKSLHAGNGALSADTIHARNAADITTAVFCMNNGTNAPLNLGIRSIIPPIDPTRKTLTNQGLSDNFTKVTNRFYCNKLDFHMPAYIQYQSI